MRLMPLILFIICFSMLCFSVVRIAHWLYIRKPKNTRFFLFAYMALFSSSVLALYGLVTVKAAAEWFPYVYCAVILDLAYLHRLPAIRRFVKDVIRREQAGESNSG